MSFQDFPPTLMVLSPRLTKASDPGSSVVGINTTPLADGAITYCIENKLAYRLDRTSVAAPDGNLILAPLAGPGRWLADVAPSPASSLGGIIQLLDDIQGGFFAASDTYVGLGGSTNYGFQGSGFTLNTTGCILTYTGTEVKTFLVIGAASNSSPPGTPATFSWGVAHNDDLIGQTILGGASGPAGCCLVNLPDDNTQLMTSILRRVTLSPGDTLRPVGADAGDTAAVSMTTMSISVQECA